MTIFYKEPCTQRSILKNKDFFNHWFETLIFPKCLSCIHIFKIFKPSIKIKNTKKSSIFDNSHFENSYNAHAWIVN